VVRRHRIRLWGSYRKVRDCVANTIAGDAGAGARGARCGGIFNVAEAED